MKELCEYKERWALHYREKLPIRGNNTNNFVESNFNTFKDLLLGREKTYNINALLEKLLEDLPQHYQQKMSLVASGKFDGNYSIRFKGQKKKRGKAICEGIGYSSVTEMQSNAFFQDLICIQDGVYIAPSLTDGTKAYVVDMQSGLCGCKIGLNGAPCKHQRLIWAKLRINSRNFLPYFSKEDRQMFAKIAYGESLPLAYYQGFYS